MDQDDPEAPGADEQQVQLDLMQLQSRRRARLSHWLQVRAILGTCINGIFQICPI